MRQFADLPESAITGHWTQQNRCLEAAIPGLR
jgi:hypothetical protein